MKLRYLLPLLLAQAAPACAQFVGSQSAPDPFQIIDTGLPFPDTMSRDTTARTLSAQAINTAVQNCVLIAAGQSNMQNIAPTAFTPVNGGSVDNLNPYDGAIYAAKDPQLGAQIALGTALAVFRLADALVTAGKCARVILVPIAIDGSTVAGWETGGESTRLPVAIKRVNARLKNSGTACGQTNVTCVILWGQGETDCKNGTSSAAYLQSLTNVQAAAAAAGFVGRWLVARQTWEGSFSCSSIQNAQAAAVDNVTTFAGANGDVLVGNVCNGANACRQGDNIHWSDNGAIAYSTDPTNGWQQALHAMGAPF